jgi:hypothetical protein
VVEIVEGYHQVPVAAANVLNAAILAPFGLPEILLMTFGLKDAGQSFQRLTDKIFCIFHSSSPDGKRLQGSALN